MTRLEPAKTIESIVGIRRDPVKHYGRAVSAERRVYILHSEACKKAFDDLRDCPFSEALDGGIFYADWDGEQDKPIMLGIDPYGWLTPAWLAEQRAMRGEGDE